MTKIKLAAMLCLFALASGCVRERPRFAESPGEEPVRGGVLVVGTSSDPGTLNPGTSNRSRVTHSSSLFYNSLLSLDEQFRTAPDLAERFEVEEDGLVYRFILRDGVKWHDDRPFTSADVKFTYEEVLLKYHPTTAGIADSVSSIETPNERTVVFRLKQPLATFPLRVTFLAGPILPKHVFEGTDPRENPASSKPVGTGPFKFSTYDKDSEIRLVRNPDYFKEGLPYLDEVVIRIIPDVGAQMLALEKGEVDYLFDIDPSYRATLAKNEQIVTSDAGSRGPEGNCITSVGMNQDFPALKDVRVRQAIFHAVDRKEILDRVYFGQGRLATSPISSGIPWAHVNSQLPTFNPGEASRLLDQAGWQREGGGRVARGVSGVTDGTTLKFTQVGTTDEAVGIANLFRERLKAVGIDVEVNQLSASLATERVYEKRDVALSYVPTCQGPDPDIMRDTYHSESILPFSGTNASGYRNPVVDELLDNASIEQDTRERANLYKRIQDILVEDLPHVWIHEVVDFAAFSKSCSGFDSSSPRFAETAWCDREES